VPIRVAFAADVRIATQRRCARVGVEFAAPHRAAEKILGAMIDKAAIPGRASEFFGRFQGGTIPFAATLWYDPWS